ncbi:hypothetical protein RRG08_024847 [Elysia crispata]|uniref:Uncharacterized protein n=1 Tax=Elysia crispata TaxID=231223 RepID=A0AAE0YJC5_9GAST|nr:hypothetical protein RRG08_024847 [Elysia crispata]
MQFSVKDSTDLGDVKTMRSLYQDGASEMAVTPHNLNTDVCTGYMANEAERSEEKFCHSGAPGAPGQSWVQALPSYLPGSWSSNSRSVFTKSVGEF